MEGRAVAPAAGTVLNALACGKGSAFAIDVHTTAEVRLSAGEAGISGEIADAPDGDTRLVERCVELAVSRYGDRKFGGTVRTDSEVPMASGLKSSSAAANATVLATLDALGVAVPREEAARLGVEAARQVGVTVTGAFDDASASMLGGVTVTDNREDELLARESVDWDVLVWTPPEQAFSADADLQRCERIAPVAETIANMALDGRYAEAMTVNGFAFCAALEQDAEPMIEALAHVDGVSLSGTGPSFVAVGDRDSLTEVNSVWEKRPGTTILTTTNDDGSLTR